MVRLGKSRYRAENGIRSIWCLNSPFQGWFHMISDKILRFKRPTPQREAPGKPPHVSLLPQYSWLRRCARLCARQCGRVAVPYCTPANKMKNGNKGYVWNNKHTLKRVTNILNETNATVCFNTNVKCFICWMHSEWFIGGNKPENNCHCVIDKPESVNLVKPPTIIIRTTNQNINANQREM